MRTPTAPHPSLAGTRVGQTLRAFACAALPSLLFAATSLAQPAAPPLVRACADTDLARLSSVCALSPDHDAVRRVKDAEVVGKRSLWRPIPLARLVVGDSALAYAYRYEHHERVATRLTYVGLGLIAGSFAVAASYRCGARTSVMNRCTNAPDNYQAAAGTMFGAGFTLGLVRLVYRRRAWGEAQMAIWWHNAGLSEGSRAH